MLINGYTIHIDPRSMNGSSGFDYEVRNEFNRTIELGWHSGPRSHAEHAVAKAIEADCMKRSAEDGARYEHAFGPHWLDGVPRNDERVTDFDRTMAGAALAAPRSSK